MDQQPRMPEDYRFFNLPSFLIAHIGVFVSDALTDKFLPDATWDVNLAVTIPIAIAIMGVLSLGASKVFREPPHQASLITGTVSGIFGLVGINTPNSSEVRMAMFLSGEVLGFVTTTVARATLGIIRTR